MNEPNIGAEFLQRKYKLNTDPGVVATAKKTKIPEYNYQARIQSYLDRLSHLINPPLLEGHPNFDRKQRNLEMLKKNLYDQFIIKTDEIPESYFKSIERRNFEEGRGDIKLPENIRLELAQTITEDQKKSLDRWVNYLSSDEVKKYPDWLRYFTFRSVLNMGRYDKGKKSFTERTGGVTAPFPDLNHEALNVILEDLETTYGKSQAKDRQKLSISNLPSLQFTGRYDISEESKNKYREYMINQNFEKLYALTLEEYKPIADELLRITEGQWKLYPEKSNPKLVVDSIAPFGTGWCLRGEGMTRQYLHGSQNIKKSNLLIYYSKDKKGEFTIPRVVMVIRDNRIDEVRGVWPGENLDPYIGGVVDTKLNELPDGAKYKKKSADMKKLTEIYYKVYPEKAFSKKDQRRKNAEPKPLNREDLIFLYEVDGSIQGFGLEDQEDPRIAELRSTRNAEEDMLVIFDCERSQIARNTNEIGQNTKAYIGQLQTGVFDQLSRYKIEHIYTSFPEGKIRLDDIEIGGKSAEQLEKEIKQIGQISPYAKDMLHSYDFTTLKNPTSLGIVRLKVRDLGFNEWTTTDQIYKRVQELGLDLCPAEVGPHLRLKDKDQPMSDWYYVGMKQISDSVGNPRVFELGRSDDGLWLDDGWARPDNEWHPGHGVVFSLRKRA